MAFAMLLLGLVVTVLVTGAIPLRSGEATGVFAAPGFIALVLLVVLAMLLASARRRRPPWRWAAFAACHLAVVAIVIGAILGHVSGRRRSLTLPANGAPLTFAPSTCKDPALREFIDTVQPLIQQATGRRLDPGFLHQRLSDCTHTAAEREHLHFGFPVAVESFAVEYYPPQGYDLFAGGGGRSGPVGTVELDHADPDRPLRLELDEEAIRGPPLPVDDAARLRAGLAAAAPVVTADLQRDGRWLEVHHVGEDFVLQRRGKPKHFEATLQLGDGDPRVIKVNHPLTHGGWRFYLSSYRKARPDLPEGHHGQVWLVTLLARHDPGRPWAIAGLWMLIVGTAALCLGPGRSRRAAAGKRVPAPSEAETSQPEPT